MSADACCDGGVAKQKTPTAQIRSGSKQEARICSKGQLAVLWSIVYPIATVLGSSFCFSMSYFAAKSLDGISGIELGSVRSALMAVMIIVPAAVQRQVPEMFSYGKARAKLLFRCTLGVVGTICIYTGVKFIDLPDFTAIQYTYLVMTAILARIFLKEKFGVVKVFATLLALIGVIMVTKPDLFRWLKSLSAARQSGNVSAPSPALFSSNQTLDSRDGALSLRTLGVVLSLCSAFVSASVFCVVKRLVTGDSALKSSVIVFNCSWFTAIALLILSFFHRLVSHSLPSPSWKNSGYVVMGSMSALFAHLLQNEALRVSSATFVAIGRSSSIVFGIVFQCVINPKSVTEKHAVSFAGIAIIILAVVIITLDTMLSRSALQPVDQTPATASGRTEKT